MTFTFYSVFIFKPDWILMDVNQVLLIICEQS